LSVPAIAALLLVAVEPPSFEPVEIACAAPAFAVEPAVPASAMAETASPASEPLPAPQPVLVHSPALVPEDEDAIIVKARQHPKGDPLEGVNIQTFEVMQVVDKILVRPLAGTYQRILPDPVRSGFRNALNNLKDPVAFLNFLLQLKPGKAAETLGRFAINSTVGVAGLFDMAKRRPINLPRRPNGFANTFGYYGVKQGAFLYLPLLGPTTVRDVIGDTMDRLFLPIAVGKPFSRPYYAIPIGTLSSIDQRAQFDEKLQELHTDSDPYAATRKDYLEQRQAVIDALHTRAGVIDSPGRGPVPAPAVRLPKLQE